MPEEYTIEYNTGNYYEAVKACGLVMYSLDMYDETPNTIYLRDYSYNQRIAQIRKESHKELEDGWRKLSKL